MNRFLTRGHLGPLLLAVVMSTVAALAVAQPPSDRFRQLDRDGDGVVTRSEFQDAIFEKIDADADGRITVEEERQFLKKRLAGAAPAGGPPRLPDNVKAELDLPYAGTDNPKQRLDLYLPRKPAANKPLPVIAFIHGGGWKSGDKRGAAGLLAGFTQSGNYATASIGYRLTDEASWPAQIHDCKAAIRWLRANAATYNLDPDRIGVMGTSAGGHLVAMLGTSGDVAELEGSLGEHRDQSSRVKCVVDQFGPTDFTAIFTEIGWARDRPDGAVALLLGGPVSERRDASRAASPITYISKDDPPFMCVHGTDDAVVPFSQSELLDKALAGVDVECVLLKIEGAGHGGFPPAVADRIRKFFDKHLRGHDHTLADEHIEEPGRTGGNTPAARRNEPGDRGREQKTGSTP